MNQTVQAPTAPGGCTETDQPSRWLRRGVLPAAAMLAAMLSAAPALAAIGDSKDWGHASVNSVTPNSFVVLNNGLKYTRPKIPNISLSADVEVDIQSSGRINEWATWLYIKPKNDVEVSFPMHSVGES